MVTVLEIPKHLRSGANTVTTLGSGAKFCAGCDTVKPLAEFHKNRRRPDGKCSRCKACYRLIYATKRQEIADQKRRYHATARYRLARKPAARRYRAKNRDKAFARNAVSRAIKAGTLIRMPCEVCGEPKTEAHHDDYSKLLDVRWLCFEHHLAVHGKRPMNLRGSHAAETRPLGPPLRDDG